MNARPILCGLATATLAALSTGCSSAFDGARYSQTVQNTVSHALPVLRVHDPVGRVRVEAWNKSSVQIDAVKKGPTEDAVHAITTSVTPSGDTLAVDAQLNGHTNRNVDFTIHLPATTDVIVDGNVGDIVVDGMTHNVAVTASVGRVTVTMARLGAGQRVTISSDVGAANLIVPQHADATFKASTSVGGISSDIPLQIKHETVSASASGSVGTGAAAVSITTSTGAIHIRRE
jgi:hypothetical protein